MSTIRLYIDGPIAPGASIELDEARTHYLGRVMRRLEGDLVELFDGASGGFAGVITRIGKRGATIEVDRQLQPMPDRSGAPVLFQAIIKRPRFEWLVEKATELDVGVIVPVRMHRVAVPLGRLDRLSTIAMEAAEQSGRLDVPAIEAETALGDIGRRRRPGTPLLVLDPTARERAVTIAERAGGRLDVLVGPEGGFAPEDHEALASMDGVVRGRISPTVLRAETAAIAGLAATAMFRCRPILEPSDDPANRVEPMQNRR